MPGSLPAPALPESIVPSSPPARRCRGSAVVAGPRFGSEALARSQVLPEAVSPAASPWQTSQPPRGQKGPIILHPYVCPTGSRGMPGMDVVAGWFFTVGPRWSWGGGVRLGFTPVLPCCQASKIGQKPPLQAGLQRPWWAKGSAFLPPFLLPPPRPCSSHSALSSPCLHSAGVKGPGRPGCHCWVPAARGSVCPLPQRGAILPTVGSWNVRLPAFAGVLDGHSQGFLG